MQKAAFTFPPTHLQPPVKFGAKFSLAELVVLAGTDSAKHRGGQRLKSTEKAALKLGNWSFQDCAKE